MIWAENKQYITRTSLVLLSSPLGVLVSVLLLVLGEPILAEEDHGALGTLELYVGFFTCCITAA